VKFGKLYRTENLDKKSGANGSYWRILIKNQDNEYETLLITDYELSRCRDRAKKNPEDLLVVSWWGRVKALFVS
jgi:hypothetical protein